MIYVLIFFLFLVQVLIAFALVAAAVAAPAAPEAKTETVKDKRAIFGEYFDFDRDTIRFLRRRNRIIPFRRLGRTSRRSIAGSYRHTGRPGASSEFRNTPPHFYKMFTRQALEIRYDTTR